ncbi:MAG: hypothetical protein K0A94_06905 [Desulfuromonadales bacterium]|nr:hypothetical protein [Desulfuromonadales bacterium]
MNSEPADFELTPESTLIRGFWIDLGSRMEKDSGWIRIEWLIANRLELVKPGETAVGQLYRYPVDNSLWHYWLVAPQMADGGPPALEKISEQQAATIFGYG